MDYMSLNDRSSKTVARLNNSLTSGMRFRYGVILRVPCLHLILFRRVWSITCARNYMAFPMTSRRLNKPGHHLFKEWRVACSAQSYYIDQCRIIVNFSDIWIRTTRCIRRSEFQNIVCQISAILSDGSRYIQNRSWGIASRISNHIIHWGLQCAKQQLNIKIMISIYHYAHLHSSFCTTYSENIVTLQITKSFKYFDSLKLLKLVNF